MDKLPAGVVNRIHELEEEDPHALVAVFDVFGYYLYASPHHRQVLGYTPNQLSEMNLAQLVVRSEHGSVFMLRTIVTIYTKPIHFSAHMITRSGERVLLSGYLYHLQLEGTRYFITCTQVDSEV